jgi:predicted flap endonuclease-1-like 5' DNA nuclease/tetrahydromethanopterin S-methyltransferase subunit B
MWFLLIQILPLMLFAALAGAMLAYWWMRNRYEDVTETYEDLMDRSALADARPGVTREDLAAHFAAIEERLSTLPTPVTRDELYANFSSMGERLTSLPIPDVSPINARLQAIESRLADSGSTFDPVISRLADLDMAVGQLKNTDLDSLEARLSRIEDNVNVLVNSEPPQMPELPAFPDIPEVDLGPIHSGLARLELALENIDVPMTDLEPIRSDFGQMEARLAEFAEGLDAQRKADNESMTIRLQTLSSSLASLRMPDVDSLRERLAKLETAIGNLSQTEIDLGPVTETLRQMERDLKNTPDHVRLTHNKLADLEGGTAALHSKLAALEAHVSTMDRTPLDLSPLQARFANIESSMAALRIDMQSLPDVAPLERRLAALQESVLTLQDPDLSSVTNSLRKMEARLNMGAVEDRLTSIEYGMAAMHHMVRTLQETAYTRTDIDYSQRVPLSAAQFTQRTEPAPAAPPPPPPPPPPPAATETVRTVEIRRGVDPIAGARRPDDKANLLVEAAFGREDDLERVNGIGPMLAELLNEIGVFYFWQIAEWGPDEIRWVDDKLEHFKGRIQRDDWVGQAKQLAAQPDVAQRPGTA